MMSRMKKSKGFTLIELLIVIAFLGIIAAIIILNISSFRANHTTGNETVTSNATIFQQLGDEPISSLNHTQLIFMTDYCLLHGHPQLALVYQNQIIILELQVPKEMK